MKVKSIAVMMASLVAVPTLMCSCSSESVTPKDDEELRTNKLVEAYLENCTPAEREAVIEKRKANLKMGKYIDIVGREYRVSISKSQAREIGVSDSLYDVIVEELEEFNRLIAESDAKGDTLELDDPKKEAEEYQRAGYNF